MRWQLRILCLKTMISIHDVHDESRQLTIELTGEFLPDIATPSGSWETLDRTELLREVT